MKGLATQKPGGSRSGCRKRDRSAWTIAEEILKQRRRALAKGISAIENNATQREIIIQKLNSHTGRAYVIGVTGSTGAGKSSLINMLTKEIRRCGLTVGILAVDPTSPFSGGALLGDRIRMQDHLADEGVFIRSMGSRGCLDGLARTTKDTIKLIDAFGMDVILVETVGVGQLEVEVMYAVDTTVLVLTPGTGDVIQTLKAGIMEIADIFAVNKCDLDGAHRKVREVEGMLELDHGKKWRPKVVMTTIKNEQGYKDLYGAIGAHRQYMEKNGLLQQKRIERMGKEVVDILVEKMRAEIKLRLSSSEECIDLMHRVANRHLDTYAAADKIMSAII